MTIKLIIARSKLETSQDYLSYTFRQGKEEFFKKSSTHTPRNSIKKQKVEGLVFDIENTFKLNIDCLINFFPPSNKFTQPQKRVIFKKLENIHKLFSDKKSLRIEHHDLGGKILINQQIIEESKRRKNESANIYIDNLKELNENYNKKCTLVKQFLKKFNEVEIFIQRESQNILNIENYGHWKTFSIVTFISKNEFVLKRKAFFEFLIEELTQKAQKIFDDNSNIQESHNKVSNAKNILKLYETYKEIMTRYYNNLVNSYQKKERLPNFPTSVKGVVNLDADLQLNRSAEVNLDIKSEYIGNGNNENINENEDEDKLNQGQFEINQADLQDDEENYDDLPADREIMPNLNDKDNNWDNISDI